MQYTDNAQPIRDFAPAVPPLEAENPLTKLAIVPLDDHLFKHMQSRIDSAGMVENQILGNVMLIDETADGGSIVLAGAKIEIDNRSDFPKKVLPPGPRPIQEPLKPKV